MRGWTIRRMHAHRDAEARGRIGMEYLRQGFHSDGWALYESRLDMDGHPAQSLPTDAPLWDGRTPFSKDGLLLWHEQGLGDTILLLRYVPWVRRMGGRIVLAVEAPLRRLAASIAAGTELICTGDVFEDVAVQLPLFSLPHRRRTRVATIPGQTPYLAAPADALTEWRSRLGPKSLPRIGLICSGSPINEQDQHRSIPLGLFAPLLRTPGVEFHFLQNHLRESDQAAHQAMPGLRLHCDAIGDLADVAALASEMDLVISVCTAGAHVAGALGVPTWIPLQRFAYHIWLTDREDSPWYPSVRLFRQTTLDEWEPVIERLRIEIPAFLAGLSGR